MRSHRDHGEAQLLEEMRQARRDLQRLVNELMGLTNQLTQLLIELINFERRG